MVKFCFKRNTNLQKKATLTIFHYVMNPSVFGIHIYS